MQADLLGAATGVDIVPDSALEATFVLARLNSLVTRFASAIACNTKFLIAPLQVYGHNRDRFPIAAGFGSVFVKGHLLQAQKNPD